MNLENDSKWIFKYMPFNLNAVKILTNNELWFGKPDTQNDPNEAEFNLRYNLEINNLLDFIIIIKDELEVLANQTDSGYNNPTGYERLKFEKELKKTIRDYLGICSMSVKYNDILMWAHYSNNNRGICIVFDKDLLLNSLKMESSKVTYSTSISNAKFVKNEKVGHLISDRVFYMDKLENWSSEGEFRFVKRYNDRIPQTHIDRFESFPDDAIVGIIVGEKFPIEDFKTLINLAYSKNPNKEFYFWRCAKNLFKNTMDIIEISDKNVDIYLNQHDYPLEYTLKYTKDKLGIILNKVST